MTDTEFVTLIESMELSPRTKNRLIKYCIPPDAKKIVERCVNAYDLLCSMDEITSEIRYFGDFGRNEVVRELKKICGIVEDKPKISRFEKIKQMSVEEMARFIDKLTNDEGFLCSNYDDYCRDCPYVEESHCTYHLVKQWLESEVKE